MKSTRLVFASVVPVFALFACSSDPVSSASDADVSNASDSSTVPSPDAAPGTDASPSDAGADVAYVEPDCPLRDDRSGQYTDTCVRREWIAAYAGTYTSASCELTISVTGPVAATFTMKVLAGARAGTYPIAWGGGVGGAGNDSYYRFTTDATYTTTKGLNFNAGEPTATGERNASLTVEKIDTGTATYKGRFSEQNGGPQEQIDCGAFTKR